MGISRSPGNKKTLHHQTEDRSDEGQEPLTQLQEHYIRLLEHLIALKSTYEGDPKREEWLLKAVNKAAYSAFGSCLEQGVEAKAKALLKPESTDGQGWTA